MQNRVAPSSLARRAAVSTSATSIKPCALTLV